MRMLFLLVALACVGLVVVLSGPGPSVPLFFSLGLVLASVVVVFFVREGRDEDIPWIVVDGSNVMTGTARTRR